MKTPTATRFIQKVTRSNPTNNKDKRKAELSTPGTFDQKVMENAKKLYTGSGIV